MGEQVASSDPNQTKVDKSDYYRVFKFPNLHILGEQVLMAAYADMYLCNAPIDTQVCVLSRRVDRIAAAPSMLCLKGTGIVIQTQENLFSPAKDETITNLLGCTNMTVEDWRKEEEFKNASNRAQSKRLKLSLSSR
jgi:hypothetical protein